MKRGWRGKYLVLLTALAISAFSESSSAGSIDALVVAAKEEGQLTVIALPRGWCGYGALIDGFEAKYGLNVTELQPDVGSADVIEVLKAHQGGVDPRAPDVIDVGLSFGPSAKEENLLQPYKVSTWATIPDAAKDADGYWYGDYFGVIAFEINADIVKKLPSDWPDLLAPEYQNSVALAGHPNSSNQAVLGVFAAGLSAAQGRVDQAADQGLRFLADLNKNGNFIPDIGDSDSLASGATPILIRWDYLALSDRDQRKNARIEVVVPKTGVVAGLYVQAISASAPHPNAAKLWMEYLYSDEGQLGWLKSYCRPVRVKDLMRNNKVPQDLMDELPYGNDEGDPDPAFPTVQEQKRAREIITSGWDAIVGVKMECVPDLSNVPMSSIDDIAPQLPSSSPSSSGSQVATGTSPTCRRDG